MLPPGIYIWETGLEGVAGPTSVDSLSSLCPSWAEDMESLSPWGEAGEIEGCGRFIKSTKETQSTTVIVEECSSTMEVAKIFSENGVVGEWGSVVAARQMQGRGQLRRHWVSPPGNLHASVCMPASPVSGEWAAVHSNLISLMAGFMLSEALSSIGAKIRIKWPNDLLQSNRKVGGILIEERNGLVVLGFGLNLAEAPSDELMREDRSVSAGILQTNVHVGGAVALWETLVIRGRSVYAILLDEMKPADFLSAISDRLAWLGSSVLVREGGDSSYQAEIVGISSEGGLIVRQGGEESVLFSGSIIPL